MEMDGILLVDKPAGITSAGVVRVLKSRVGTRKVGHLGTLDPFATGLLPLCVGEATKIAQLLTVEDKGYTGRIQLGSETDTLDRTGKVLQTSAVPPLDADRLGQLADQFQGRCLQTPPMFSAVKREGVPLYRLARRGIEVERVARPIEIRTLRLRAAGPTEIDFHVECSKGTYVRVLAADIGRALGCGGHLTALRRVRFGDFDVADAHLLGALEEWPGRTLPVVPMRRALSHLRELTIPPPAGSVLRRGRQDVLEHLPPPGSAAEAAVVVTPDGDLVAVVHADTHGRGWRVLRVLAAPAKYASREDKLYKPHPIC